jgi:LVIVD repeat
MKKLLSSVVLVLPYARRLRAERLHGGGTMNKQQLVRAFAIAIVALLGLLLSTYISLAADRIPWTGPVPKANCDPWDWTESGLQGQTTPWERESGDSEGGYNCNLELVGQFQGEGSKSQGGPAYIDHCAYYATDNNPLQEHRGVVVIDASDPRHPRAVTYLDDPVMLDPHETLKHNDRRKLLAGGQNNGPGFVVYDVSNCTQPVLKGSIDLPGSQGHMGNFAPDGLTYYLGQSFRGIGGFMYIVDVADPSNLKQLPTWQFLGDGRPHGIWLNEDGTRLYAGQPGIFGRPPTDSSFGPDGLVILDVSDYQFRRPNPQIQIISRLFWDDQGQVEEMYPFRKEGRHYIVSSDESGGNSGVGGAPAACARGASPHGYPNIIDITDERNPKIIAQLKLEVSDNANCELLLNDPPEVGGGIPGYHQERCVADRANNPTMLACAFQHAGLRVFDVRDLSRPKEIAYYKPPAMRTAFLPGSASWGPGVDRTMDRIAGYPRFVKIPANEKHGRELHIWFVSADNGFQIVRFTDSFQGRHRDLLENSVK